MRITLLILTLAAGLTWGIEPASPEVDRLRRENAALKKEVADLQAQITKLKEELAAAKPAAPKATRYTAASLVKLIPPAQLGGQWDDPHKGKVSKILEANLAGEWIQLDVTVSGVTNEDGKGRINAPVGETPQFLVRVDARFDQPVTAKEGRPASIIGKVKAVAIIQGNANDTPRLIVALTDCSLAK